MSRKLKWFERFSDADLWGLSCALQHCIDTAYFTEEENLSWAESMLAKISNIRGPEVKQ